MKYFIVVFLLLMSSIGWSQEVKFLFRGKVQNIDLGKKEGGVDVTIVQNGRTVSSVKTASSGKYTLRGGLDAKVPFEIVFSKPGLVNKRVRFDFSKMNDEDTPASAEFEPVESLDIDLFKEREGLDFSFLDTEPVAAFDWNSKKLAPKLDAGVVGRMRRKIEDLLNKAEKDKAATEAAYQAAIRDGQSFYDQEKYEEALAKYEDAAGLKPNEKLPSDRIIELDALIKAQKEAALNQAQADSEYNNLIQAADNLRDNGDLKAAVSKYKEAITKKPEQYPKDQVELLNAQISAAEKEKANQVKYDEAITSADRFMKQNSLRAAKDKYTIATELKPSEQYPKDKLKEIEAKMGDLEAKEALKKEYDAAITAADNLFSSDDFQGAKEKYQEALTYEKSATYPKERIKMCDAALADAEAEAALAQKITDLIKKGNDEIVVNSLENAKASFTEVLALDDQNAIAPPKLAEIARLIQEANDTALQEQKYLDLIASGDAADNANKLEDALAKYTEAKGVKSTTEVQTKIDAVQTKIDAAKALADNQAAYDKLIADAGQKMTSDDLAGAKTDYQSALVLDPSQSLPKDKIAEIEALLAQQSADADKKQNYDNAIAEAQGLLTAGELNNAKAKYLEAGTIDSSQSEPKDKVREIDELIAHDKERAQRQLDYQAAIDDADKLFNEAKWEEAQKRYRDAMTFDGTNPYPQRQISEIDGKIEERDNEIAKREEIKTLLADGTKLYDQQKLEDARGKFQQVLALDPNNTEATNQIAVINTVLAAQVDEEEKEAAFAALKEEGFQLASNEQYPEAKQKLQEALAMKQDQEVSAKIVEIDQQMQANMAATELDENYNNLIAEAEGRENSGDLAGAISSYQQASTIKPTEILPKDKIRELQSLVSNNASQAKLDEDYNNLIQSAQSKEYSGDLTSAISVYQQASNLKPNENLPKDKIAEIQSLITDNANQTQIDADYTKLINEASTKESAGDIDEAISKYQAASLVKPNEQLPKDKITELRSQLTNQAEVNRQYKDAMNRGDQFMAGENYLDAIGAYNEALALKPKEQEPVDKAALAEEAERNRGGVDAQYEKILSVAQAKINAGDLVKAEELAKRAKGLKKEDPRPNVLLTQIAKIRATQTDFDKNMVLAESSATSKNYQEAIDYFKIAKKVKPNETLPDERIAEMNRLMGDQNSAAQKEKLYQDNMEKGRATQGASRFPEALSHYQNALAVKPNDQPATDKINEIQQILDDLANANINEIAKKNQFDALIKAADGFFSVGEYVGDGASIVAKETYEQALTLYPTNAYAVTQRDECVKRANAEVNSEVEAAYANILKVADKKFGELDFDKAKELYTRALGLRNSDPYPKKKLAEIEAILNPPLVESVELENLGIPFDATQIDGGFVLEQDDRKRRLFKKTRLERKVDRAYASEREMIALKSSDQLETRNEITHVLSLIVDEGADSDDGRLQLIEDLRISEKERDEDARGNQQFEIAENLSTQGALDLTVEELSLQKQEDDRGHMINTDKVYSIKLAQNRTDELLSSQYIDVSYEQDEQITGYVDAALAETQSDYDDRLYIERTVDGAVGRALDLQIDLANGRSATTLDQQDQIDGVYEAKRDKFVESVRTSEDNNEQFKDVMADQHELDRLAYNGEMVKYLANQEIITAELAKKKNIQEQADEAMTAKIKNAGINKERARLAASQGEMTDLVARQNVSQSIDLVELSVEEKGKTDAQKTKENAEILEDINKTKTRQAELDAKEQQEKAYANQQVISDVDDSPKVKPIIKNALGEEYPEGVSQESFKQTDNDGLVKSILTRRIVVIEGRATVYVRTQTLNGITYSKNNRPSLENVWNSETQGPDLVRHY